MLPTTTVARHEQHLTLLDVCRRLKKEGTGGAAMKDCLDRIGGNGELSPVARLAGKLHADLAYDDERAVRRASLAFLDRVVDAVTRMHEALTAQYFVS